MTASERDGTLRPGQWRVAAASSMGSSHRHAQLPNQDACWARCALAADGAECVVIVVADGAGSATHAELGSETAVDAVGAAVASWWTHASRPELDEVLLAAWMNTGAQSLRQLSVDLECPLRDLSCTLLLAVITAERAGFAQIGDGAIVYGEVADQLHTAFWPQAGEYVNITEFLTDTHWQRHVRCRVHQGAVTHVGVLSDGLQRLALKLAEQRAHAPFFQPFWQALNALDRVALHVEFSQQLRDWLGSAVVEQRTDDDKTLALAVRTL